MSEDYPRTLLELEQRFSGDEACAGYLASVRWPAGGVCPRCAGEAAWSVRGARWRCGQCRYEMSVTAGYDLSGQSSAPDDRVSGHVACDQTKEWHQRSGIRYSPPCWRWRQAFAARSAPHA